MTKQKMTKMETDNLTKYLVKLHEGGVKLAELSAATLYKEFISASSVDGPIQVVASYAKTATDLIQKIQGEFIQFMLHKNLFNFSNK